MTELITKPQLNHPSALDTQRPSRFHLAFSVFVIAACLFFISVALAGLAATWDPCSVLGGLFMLPVPTALAISQYAAVWRRSVSASKFATGVSGVMCGFVCFASITSFGEWIQDPRGPIVELLLIFGAIAAIFAALFVANRRWTRRLREQASVSESSPWRLTLRELLLATTVIAVAAGIATAIIRDSDPRSARNIPAEDAPIDLPPAAKDVCYGRGYRGGLVVEFTTDEVTFRKWAEEELSGFELDERHECGELDIPRTVNRHRSYYTEFEGPESVEIKHGLHFGWWLDDDVFADGYFDRSTGRAYYVKY